MAQYLLPCHVFMAETEDGAVFLDLRRDQYAAINRTDLSLLQRSFGISTNPAIPGNALPLTESERIQLTEALASRGLLTTDTSKGRTYRPLERVWPTAVLADEDAVDETVLQARHVATFCACCLVAWITLRALPLETVIRRAKRTKARTIRRSPKFNVGFARKLMAAFLLLRPLIYSSKDACVYDSYTLFLFFCWNDLRSC